VAVQSSTHAAPRAASASLSDPDAATPCSRGARAVIGRIVRSVDFERVLSAPTRARSTHFAVHYVEGVPSLPNKPSAHKLSTELSTGQSTVDSRAVDDRSVLPVSAMMTAGTWVGAVVPKRHAKRSVTRSLLKRQIRAAVSRQHVAGLPDGLWVVRLRSPFAVKEFPSAASQALRDIARAELDTLLADAVRRTARA
jgi:ribonuclease P protein component